MHARGCTSVLTARLPSPPLTRTSSLERRPVLGVVVELGEELAEGLTRVTLSQHLASQQVLCLNNWQGGKRQEGGGRGRRW